VGIEEAVAPSARPTEVDVSVDEFRGFEAARALMHDYAAACDADDVDAVVSLFTDDAEMWAGPRQFQGRDSIASFYRGALGAPTCHIVGVPKLATAPDGLVEANASFLAVEMAADEPQLRWGTYADRIVIDGPSPRFVSRRITIKGSAAL
jgi:uncharacterized protein (TIGR02246 family)